jgi:putative addiction module component (TIGR02574 family)
MPSAKEIVEQAESLPVEDRVLVVDSLLRTLNPPDADIDRKWAEVAKRRLAELRSGRVTPLSGDEVLARARERFAK